MSNSNDRIPKRLRLMGDINEPSSSSTFSGDKRTDDQQPDHSQAEKQRDSLVRLNDYCLRDIFVHLDKKALCQLADVSTRVRLIAEKTFKKRYTKVYQYGPMCESQALFRQTLCKFGKLITSIYSEKRAYCSQEQIQAITKYCPNLEIFGNKLMRYPYKDSFELVANSLPKLAELRLDDACSPPALDTFRMLLSLSPQLKRLQICGYASDDHITAIIQYAKDLEELHIMLVTSKRPARLTKKGLMQLIKLKKLKRFNCDLCQLNKVNSVFSLMTGFSKKNVNLNSTSLHLEGVSITHKNLAKLHIKRNLYEMSNRIILPHENNV